jgi:hypothetical protein
VYREVGTHYNFDSDVNNTVKVMPDIRRSGVFLIKHDGMCVLRRLSKSVDTYCESVLTDGLWSP